MRPRGTCSTRGPVHARRNKGGSPVEYVPTFAYVANETTDDFSAYSINRNTGALFRHLQPIPDPVGPPCPADLLGGSPYDRRTDSISGHDYRYIWHQAKGR